MSAWFLAGELLALFFPSLSSLSMDRLKSKEALDRASRCVDEVGGIFARG